MAKVKTVYVCQQCGTQRPRWEGRCTDCGSWNSFVEETPLPETKGRGWSLGQAEVTITTLDQEPGRDERARQATGLMELDRVLGGGLVPGSFILVGGDPGIGKSTLLLQVSGSLAQSGQGVLYISAEESVRQIGIRANRLGVRSKQVKVVSESNMQKILHMAKHEKPQVMIVDSIQTVYLEDLASAPGSVAQVRECAARLMGLAKNEGLTVFVIGHVTKEGALAGPRVLEHMVDAVLSFEGDGHHHHRLLRALKNRFGATNELGVFEMTSDGLREVSNPSEIFLEDRGGELMGSVIFPALEGTRPLLCEVQALTSSSHMAMPRRTSLGIDNQRVHMLAAVLDKHLDLGLSGQDVFVNVVGGLRITEPAADLAIAAALYSSAKFSEIPRDAVFFGEIGLTGEVRATLFAEERLKEAVKLGFKIAYLPASTQKHLQKSSLAKDVKLHWISSVRDLERELKGGPRKKSHPSSHSPRREENLF